MKKFILCVVVSVCASGLCFGQFGQEDWSKFNLTPAQKTEWDKYLKRWEPGFIKEYVPFVVLLSIQDIGMTRYNLAAGKICERFVPLLSALFNKAQSIAPNNAEFIDFLREEIRLLGKNVAALIDNAAIGIVTGDIPDWKVEEIYHEFLVKYSSQIAAGIKDWPKIENEFYKQAAAATAAAKATEAAKKADAEAVGLENIEIKMVPITGGTVAKTTLDSKNYARTSKKMQELKEALEREKRRGDMKAVQKYQEEVLKEFKKEGERKAKEMERDRKEGAFEDGMSPFPGIFSNCDKNLTMTVSNFQIAETEMTYAVWYKVKLWAELNGYKFANKGFEGSNFKALGTAPTKGKNEPVTDVSWCDAVVWCNAYSEALGKTPVYYNAEGNAVLKDATKTVAVDGATIKSGATGFRLPTEVQWEYAARGGNTNAKAWNYRYAGTNDFRNLEDYAVYDFNSNQNTAPVKSKKPNTAGLYDMTGNVDEWCFDRYGDVPDESQTDYIGASSGWKRVVKGGNYLFKAQQCGIAFRIGYNPNENAMVFRGFRVVLPAE